MGDLFWQTHRVNAGYRAAQKQQTPFVVWFTGLSGAGKSTLANALEWTLAERGHHTYLLDGDNLRHGLSADLGFSEADRAENIRRAGEATKLLVNAGVVVIAAFISPFERERSAVKQGLGSTRFIQVYLDTPLNICEQRDPKGLYQKARNGELKNLTGVDAEYQIPVDAQMTLDTSRYSVEKTIERIVDYLLDEQLVLPLPRVAAKM